MRRSTAWILCLSATALVLAIIAINVVIVWKNRHATPQTSSDYTLDYWLSVQALYLAMILDSLVYIGALINMAKKREWSWFALLFLASTPVLFWTLVLMPMYLLIGPKERNEPLEQSGSDITVPGKPISIPASGSPSLSKPWTLLPGWGRYATPVERAAAAAIDLAIFGLAGLVVASAVNSPIILGFTETTRSKTDPTGLILSWLVFVFLVTYLFILGFIFVFWPAQWARRGQTFGQRALGIRVVSTSGQRIGFGAAFLRVVTLFTVAVPFGIPIGWVWVFIDPKRQGWHDKIARTIVVRDAAA